MQATTKCAAYQQAQLHTYIHIYTQKCLTRLFTRYLFVGDSATWLAML